MGPQVLNWNKVNFDGISQEFANIDLSHLFASRGISGKWDGFKSKIVRVRGMHVPVEVKGKADRNDEPLLMREIGVLVREREA